VQTWYYFYRHFLNPWSAEFMKENTLKKIE
jgi:hypothetical protein